MRLFTRLTFLTLLLNASIFAFAQRWTTADYEKWNHSTFRQDSRFSQSINLSSIDYPLLDAAIFYLTNEQRAQNSLAPLRYHPRVEIAAFNHSYKMATLDFFSHSNYIDSTRQSTSDRGKLAGISNPSFAENIAYNYSSNMGDVSYLSVAEKLIDQWMNSPGHKANILSTTGRQMGCGAYYLEGRFYGTQCFQWFNDVVETAEPPKDKAPWEEPFASNSAPRYYAPTTNNNNSGSYNSTTTTTTTTNGPTYTTSNPVVTKVKKNRSHKLIAIKLGGAIDAPLGNPPGFDYKNLSGLGYGMFGIRIPHEGHVTILGGWGTVGKYATASNELVSKIGTDETSLSFTEYEAGLIYGGWFRLSGGVGTLEVQEYNEITNEKYQLATVGFCLGRKALKFELSNSFLVKDGEMNMRPSVGLAIQMNMIKI